MTPDTISPTDARGCLGKTGSIISVQVGRVAPLGPDGVASGFVKFTENSACRHRSLAS